MAFTQEFNEHLDWSVCTLFLKLNCPSVRRFCYLHEWRALNTKNGRWRSHTRASHRTSQRKRAYTFYISPLCYTSYLIAICICIHREYKNMFIFLLLFVWMEFLCLFCTFSLAMLYHLAIFCVLLNYAIIFRQCLLYI